MKFFWNKNQPPEAVPEATAGGAAEKMAQFFQFNQQPAGARVDRAKVQQAERNLDDFTKTRCGKVFSQFINFFVLIILIFGFTLVGMAVFNRKHYHTPDKQTRDEHNVKQLFAMFGKH